jgi:hypothetical protein
MRSSGVASSLIDTRVLLRWSSLVCRYTRGSQGSQDAREREDNRERSVHRGGVSHSESIVDTVCRESVENVGKYCFGQGRRGSMRICSSGKIKFAKERRKSGKKLCCKESRILNASVRLRSLARQCLHAKLAPSAKDAMRYFLTSNMLSI